MHNGNRQKNLELAYRHVFLKFCKWMLPFSIGILFVSGVQAASQNILYRIDVKARSSYSRITFKLEKESKFSLSILSGKRLKITFPQTSSLQPWKLRTYSDSHIESISFLHRNGNSVVIIAVRGDSSAYRLIAPIQDNLVTLDVGPGMEGIAREPIQPGRKIIWDGTEKLVREFEPPLRPDVPFIPTNVKLLRKIMPEADVKLFLRGEAAIYKEKPAEAEEIFRTFINREIPVRAIAAYRLGEALYMMQKYPEALAAFREGEKVCPEYIVRNPSAIFYYADSLVREGGFEAGRGLLVRLIVGLSGTDHAPSMLVRLADIYARAGREKDALSIYRNVASNFSGTRAFYNACMRLNDRDFFTVNSITYRSLMNKYRVIHAAGSDLVLQDESLFKAALLEALYGPAGEAVTAIAGYERKYPCGIFSNIAKTMREDLLLDLYQELEKRGDCRGLLEIVGRNRDYLAKCLAEEGFVRLISKCYLDRGMVREEMTLFTEFVDSEWVTASAPFLYNRIFEDALALKEKSLAEAAARAFLEKFPRHELVWNVIGRLGEILYQKGAMEEVISVLGRLEEKGSQVKLPESFYYLGKARERLNDLAAAERAMTMFQDEVRKKELSSPFQADAFMVRATARLARGDKKGAMSMYQAGYAIAHGEYRDTFLFKMGDLWRQEGKYEAARRAWENLVKEGSDPFWKKMASQELSHLDWRTKWKFDGR